MFRILGETLRIWWPGLPRFQLIALLFLLPAIVLGSASEEGAAASFEGLLAALGYVLAGAAVAEHHGQRREDLDGAFVSMNLALRRLKSLAGFSLLLMVAVFFLAATVFGVMGGADAMSPAGRTFATVLALLGATFVYSQMAPGPAAVMLEKIRGRDAVRRSLAVMKDQRWSGFGAMLALSGLERLLDHLCAHPDFLPASSPALQQLVGGALHVTFVSLYGVLGAVLLERAQAGRAARTVSVFD